MAIGTEFKLDDLHFKVLDEWTWPEYRGKVAITGYEAVSEALEIPNIVKYQQWGESIYSYSVVQINEKVFQNCSGIASVIIPDTITKIGESAFDGCTGLERVYISDISAWCNILFESSSANPCNNGSCQLYYIDNDEDPITTITIPEEIESIGNYTFYKCFGINNIEIPDSVTSIGNGAFSYCSGLTSITIPDSVASIGEYAFAYCSGFTNMTIPDSVTSVGKGVFEGCISLQELTLPFVGSTNENNETAHLGYLFGTEDKEPQFMPVPNTLTTVNITAAKQIGDCAFRNLINLVSVNIANTVTSIGEQAFFNCTGITSITISDNVAIIDDLAFAYCTNITRVTMGDSVTSIGIEAFAYCERLASVEIGTGETANTIKIGNGAFKDCTSLEEFTLKTATTSIGEEAFSGCSKLTTYIIHGSVIKFIPKDLLTTVTITGGIVGSSAFKECRTLETVIINSDVSRIYRQAFYGCVYLSSVTIAYGVEQIGEYAFYNCIRLTSITIPGSTTIIEGGAFSNCKDLGEVCINYGDVYIGIEAFKGCTRLQSVTIAKGNPTLGKNVFFGCINLSKAQVPSSVVFALPQFKLRELSITGGHTITHDQVKNLTYLEEVSIDTIKIEEQTFYAFPFLKKVSISKGVTDIGQKAFASCQNLEICEIAREIQDCKIGMGAFAGCIKLWYAIIPEGVTSIGPGVFYGCEALDYIQAYKIESVNQDGTTTPEPLDYWFTLAQECVRSNNLKEIRLYNAGSLASGAFKEWTTLEKIAIQGPTIIPNETFYSCIGLKEILLPSTLTKIGDFAFFHCANLQSWPSLDGVETIGKGAFALTQGPETLSLPKLTSLGDAAFSGCLDLKNVILSEDLASTGKGIFANATDIESIEAPFIGSLNNPQPLDHWFTGTNNLCLRSPSLTTIKLFNTHSLADGVFKDWETIETIILTGVLKKIPASAFEGCSKLSTVTLPSSVTSIGKSAFKNCLALNTLILPSNLSELENGAFSQTGLTTVKLPSAITEIPDECFAYSSSLESIEFNDQLETIGTAAFAGDAELESPNFPDSLQKIGRQAFSWCNAIQILTIPENTTEIECGAFEGCDNIISVNLSKLDQHLGWLFGAEEYQTQGEYLPYRLQNIVFPLDVSANIPDYAFYGCRGLRYIQLPFEVESIGEAVFQNCTGLEFLTLPRSKKSFPKGILKGCDDLAELTIPWVGAGDSVHPHFGELFGSEDYITQKDYLPSRLWTVKLQQASEIPKNAFYGCDSLQSIILSDTISTIGESAFEGCTDLDNLNIPSTVTSIKSKAFYGCQELAAMSLPQGLKNLGDQVFAYCDSLYELSIVSSETANGKYKSKNNCIYTKNNNTYEIIYGCNGSKILQDPGVTTIADMAFKGASQILLLSIPNNITKIGSQAFSGCSKLQEVIIPDSVTYIGANAFEDCVSLTAITLPFVGSGSINDIKDYQSTPAQIFSAIFNGQKETNKPGIRAIQQCYKPSSSDPDWNWFYIPEQLKSVHITARALQPGGMSGVSTERIRLSNIDTIGCWFFTHNTMDAIDIDNTLRKIGESAFEECVNLKEVILPPDFEILGTNAFKGTNGLKQILIYSTKWDFETKTTDQFASDTKVYMPIKPQGADHYLPVNSYVARAMQDLDFLGFWFDGLHSYYDLGVYRASNGLATNNLTPKMEHTAVKIPGNNGQYYFGTVDRERIFTVNFAFDRLTEDQLRKWQTLCHSKNMGELVFDEAPYKTYMAKITGTPKLQYIPFVENGQRIYKGNGTIEFTCYYPYAHTPNGSSKMISKLWEPINSEAAEPTFLGHLTCKAAYFDNSYPTKKEWIEVTNMPEKPTTGVNPGDLPAPFLLKTLARVYNGTVLYVGDANITIKQDTNAPVHWDSRSGLVYTVDSTGNKKPVYYTGNSIATIPITDTPIEWSPGAKLEYDYWYY